MSSRIVLLIGILFLQTALAHDAKLVNEQDGVISVKSFPLKNGKGSVFVIIRKDGHAPARPYIIELRPACGADVTEWRNLQVVDSRSVCDIAPDTSSLVQNQAEISVMVRDVNSAKMEKTMRMTASEAQNVCTSKGRVERLSIKDFCN